ncbi:hypothetical protein [Agrococcus sp. SGAir0287]|uniref:hypothetical protein n=1 Tax=Agrococcus sp. SGAir0287 TaxID=2070347 RepID=UPI0010F60FB7|nr:hypothetical protein [Agrococcus sp. SGAir0287]
MIETAPSRRRFWLAGAVAVGGIAIAILWIVAISGPEICGWGGPPLCFRPYRAKLAGIATISILVAVALLALASLIAGRRPAPFRAAFGAVILAIAAGTAACVGAMS